MEPHSRPPPVPSLILTEPTPDSTQSSSFSDALHFTSRQTGTHSGSIGELSGIRGSLLPITDERLHANVSQWNDTIESSVNTANTGGPGCPRISPLDNSHRGPRFALIDDSHPSSFILAPGSDLGDALSQTIAQPCGKEDTRHQGKNRWSLLSSVKSTASQSEERSSVWTKLSTALISSRKVSTGSSTTSGRQELEITPFSGQTLGHNWKPSSGEQERSLLESTLPTLGHNITTFESLLGDKVALELPLEEKLFIPRIGLGSILKALKLRFPGTRVLRRRCLLRTKKC